MFLEDPNGNCMEIKTMKNPDTLFKKSKMKLNTKLNEYKNNIETLRAIESLEVYRWLISLGERLNDDPLSEERRTIKNKVKSCQFELFVDYENGRFKSWSKAMVSAGYAYILIDIFNSLPIEEAKKITINDFKKIKMDELLTMSRKTGFYEMIEIMIGKLKNVRN